MSESARRIRRARTQRIRFSAEFRRLAGTLGLTGLGTPNEVAREHRLHSSLLVQWMGHLAEERPALIADKWRKGQRQREEHEL